MESDDSLTESDSLEFIDLRFNPLIPKYYEMLKSGRVSFHVILFERQKEEWEDLNI